MQPKSGLRAKVTISIFDTIQCLAIELKELYDLYDNKYCKINVYNKFLKSIK